VAGMKRFLTILLIKDTADHGKADQANNHYTMGYHMPKVLVGEVCMGHFPPL